MDPERVIATSLAGLIGAVVGFAGVAMYDTGRYHFSWEPSQRESLVAMGETGKDVNYSIVSLGEDTRHKFKQMKPSGHFYWIIPSVGAAIGSAGFRIGSREKK